MSAPPSATRPSFTADPNISRTAPGLAAINASVLASPCERLTATVQGAPGAGCLRVWIGSGAPSDVSPTLSRSAPRAHQPAPDQSERRRADDAEQRRAVGHQREIDREFVAAGDKFLGAIQRIDQKETAGIRRFRQMDALLGQRRYLGSQPRETFADDPVGGEIRLRHRRSVEPCRRSSSPTG